MIRVIIDGQEVFRTQDRGWLKKNLMIDVVDHKRPTRNTIESNIALPMAKDYDVVLRFGKRPETDLGLKEELARDKLMDREALQSLERTRLQEMKITDPHHPDYIAPDNVTDETAEKIEQAIEEESLQPLVGEGYDPEIHKGDDPTEPGTLDEEVEIDKSAPENDPDLDLDYAKGEQDGTHEIPENQSTGTDDDSNSTLEPDGVTVPQPGDPGEPESSDITEGGSDTVHPVGRIEPGSSSDIAFPDANDLEKANAQGGATGPSEENNPSDKGEHGPSDENNDNPGGDDFRLRG